MSCTKAHSRLTMANENLRVLARKANSPRYPYGPPLRMLDQINETKRARDAERRNLDEYHAENGCDMEGTS